MSSLEVSRVNINFIISLLDKEDWKVSFLFSLLPFFIHCKLKEKTINIMVLYMNLTFLDAYQGRIFLRFMSGSFYI